MKNNQNKEFDAMIEEGIKSKHVPLTDSVWKGIRRRGTKAGLTPTFKPRGSAVNIEITAPDRPV